MTIRENLNLFTPLYDEAMIEEWGREDQMHPSLFDVRTDATKQVDMTSVTGLGVWADMEETEPVPQEDMVQMYNKTWLHAKKGKGFKVSFEAQDDDEHALINKVDTARAMGMGAMELVETDTANIFDNHITTAGPDGVALVDAQHPLNTEQTSTYLDNEITGATSALDHDALETMELQVYNNLKNPKSGLIPIPAKKILLVPPALEGTALRIVSDRAGERPGTAERDINVYAGKYEVKVWRFLDGSATAWWVVYPTLKGLRFYWRRKPHFTSYIDHVAQSYVFEGTMRYSIGPTPGGWRQVWGSVGA